MNFNKSIKAFEEAKQYIPGGVNSPVRAFKSVHNNPVFIKLAKGAYITDIDDNTYIDYVASWGPMILGHSHPQVIEALKEAIPLGTSYGAPTITETNIANLITKINPSLDKLRMVNSGTEATMSALRLARGFTQRELVIKFEGCYHGHGDSFLIKAGSGALTFGMPNSPGITKGTAHDTLTASYNDISSVEVLFDNYPDQIAAIILEPVTGNMGVVKPKPEFLTGLKNLCDKYGTLLIFDEVMTGFRVALGGAAELFNIKPDLITYGKIIGGGLPVGAYGGRKEIMDMLAPDGPVYQAGTLSGNPMAMTAGLTTLNILSENEDIYNKLEKLSARLEDGLNNNLKETGIPGIVNRVGSMFTLFFTEKESVNSFNDVMTCNTKLFADYFNLCLENGIYTAPSQYEAGFISAAHTEKDIDITLEKNLEALKKLKGKSY